MFRIPFFGTWRTIWEKDQTLSELLGRSDQIASLRNRGRQDFPELILDEDTAQVVKLLHGMCRDHKKPKPGKEFYFYHAYVMGILQLRPLVESSRWVRWLYLEQTLAVAGATGDLLTAALALRTQIEELSVLTKLQEHERLAPRSCEELEQVKVPTPKMCVDVRAYADFLWDWILPRVEIPDNEQLARPRKRPRKPAGLDDAFFRLNDYVHPNYGSHVVLLAPDRSVAGSALLTAFVGIYEHFLKLDWANDPSQESEDGRKVPEVQAAGEELARFSKGSAPSLDALVHHFGFENARYEVSSKALRVGLERESQDNREMATALLDESNGELADCRKDMVTWLGQICAVVSGVAPTSIQDVVATIQANLGLGFPRSLTEAVFMMRLRRDMADLETVCRTLASGHSFPSTPPYDRWIEFMERCADLAVNVSLMKSSTLALAIIRMLNGRNPLGAALCARSLLEHYACGCYLAQRVDQAMKEAEAAARSNVDVKPALDQLEGEIAVFLSGTRHTDEVSTYWRDRFRQTRTSEYLPLGEIVEEVLPRNTMMGHLYAVFCRAVHGEWFCGTDLHPDADSKNGDRLCARTFVVLADVEEFGKTADIVAPIWRSMWRLTRSGGPIAARTTEELAAVLTKGSLDTPVLERGRDLFGSGTREDRFRFRSELQYHFALHKFLTDEGLEFQEAKFLPDENGSLERIRTRNGRDLYFVVT